MTFLDPCSIFFRPSTFPMLSTSASKPVGTPISWTAIPLAPDCSHLNNKRIFKIFKICQFESNKICRRASFWYFIGKKNLYLPSFISFFQILIGLIMIIHYKAKAENMYFASACFMARLLWLLHAEIYFHPQLHLRCECNNLRKYHHPRQIIYIIRRNIDTNQHININYPTK